MLEPMLLDKEVARTRGDGARLRGFETLRLSLYLSCVQDIAKLTFDRSDHAPSIHKIVAALADASLLGELRDRYAVWTLPDKAEDDEVREALKRMELREQAHRREQFDCHVRDLQAIESAFKTSAEMQKFLTVRDKITAHSEIRFVADKYQLFDLKNVGLKWNSLSHPIAEMQRAVELIGFVVRNAGFAWDMLDAQLSKASKAFWA